MKHPEHLSAVGPHPVRSTRPEFLGAPAPRFNGSSRELNKFFKALSDETRRNILRLLEQSEFTVGEIVGNFHLSQPTISRHLSVLKEARLVVDQRQGQHVVYRLSNDTLARSVSQFFRDFEQCQQILR
ncbi:MAG: metalloregulator ArsR/SmtB family transcription factor [Acidobacteriota bacterium]|nr:metalloregulator ArsR/SmtB family transcription factor [Acidobacteriota bacterium]